MLGKLIKNEFKATKRVLIPANLAVIITALIGKMILSIDVNNVIIEKSISAIYVLELLTVVTGSFIFILIRFYKNLLMDEGYLMFTLPTKSVNLITSKLVVGVVWEVINIVIVVASAIFLFDKGGQGIYSSKEILKEIEMITDIMGINTAVFVIGCVVFMIIGCAINLITVYFCMAIGQVISKNKILGSIVAYVVFTTAMQFVTLITMIIYGTATSFREKSIFESLPILALVSMVLCIIFSIACYIATNYILSKKLNLE